MVIDVIGIGLAVRSHLYSMMYTADDILFS